MKVAAIRGNAEPTGLTTRYVLNFYANKTERAGIEKLPRCCFRLKGDRPLTLANIGGPAI